MGVMRVNLLVLASPEPGGRQSVAGDGLDATSALGRGVPERPVRSVGASRCRLRSGSERAFTTGTSQVQKRILNFP